MTVDEALIEKVALAIESQPNSSEHMACAAINALLAYLRESGFSIMPIEATARHKKRGTTYDVLTGPALLQTDTPISDMAEVVVYRWMGALRSPHRRAAAMGDYTELEKRLRDLASHLSEAYPDYEEAADAIATLTRELERSEGLRECHITSVAELTDERDSAEAARDVAIARADEAEKEIELIVAREAETVETAFKLQAILREAREDIEDHAEMREREGWDALDQKALLSRIAAATQTGEKDHD